MPQYNSFLPREGLYIDPIVLALRKTVLNPVFSLPLFGASQLFIPADSSLSRQVIGYTALLGCLLQVNDWFSAKSRNNWVTDDNWDWEKEIVAVTGGSSGIGASIVNRLADDRVKVVVIDIVPLTYKIGRVCSDGLESSLMLII